MKRELKVSFLLCVDGKVLKAAAQIPMKRELKV